MVYIIDKELEMLDINEKLNEVVKKYFGYDSLREGQKELVEGILSNKDVLGIMPTGAGKSLCYQAAALILEGITIVVSPLISLMSDQVKALNQAGVHAAYINSSLTEGQIVKALELAKTGRYKIIYVAPERLRTSKFIEFACNSPISMLTIDEAHCISQWGQDFRPSYREITEFLNILPVRPIVSAFTATATERVKIDICSILKLQQPQIIITGFDRPNLYFRVIERKGGKETENGILNYVQKHSEDSGIIYCATRKNVDKVYDILKNYGILAGRYHGGMSMEERNQVQFDFTYDKIQVMVATNAFGMGIDKSNVRYVLHYNMPQSLEYYYQEAGRAGRDGEDAECILFFSKQDIMINRRLLDMKTVDAYGVPVNPEVRQSDLNKLYRMIEYCETDQCLREFMLNYFGEKGECTCKKCSNCIVDKEMYNEPIIIGKRKSKGDAIEIAGLTEEGTLLFNKLKAMRMGIAIEKNLPPYVICSDKTLKDMCLKLPDTLEKMDDIYGMGAQKIQSYGQLFLEEINSFIESKGEGITLMQQIPDSKKSKVKADFYITKEQADLLEFDDEMMVSEIANRINQVILENDCKKISAKVINEYLIKSDYLYDETDTENGKTNRRVSDLGSLNGIREELRTGRNGDYYAIIHSPKSANKIISLLLKANQIVE